MNTTNKATVHGRICKMAVALTPALSVLFADGALVGCSMGESATGMAGAPAQ